MALSKVCLGDGFEAHEQALAPASPGEFQQFGIVREHHRRKAIPLHAKRNESGEKLQRVTAMCDEVQIHEDQLPRAVLADVRDDFGNRFLKWLSPPRRRNDAEITAVHAPSRRLENIVCEKVPRRQQLAPRERSAADLKPGRLLIAPLHSTSSKVTK